MKKKVKIKTYFPKGEENTPFSDKWFEKVRKKAGK